MTPFVFCCRAASADLGVRDAGRQQLYLANRPPLVSASILSLLSSMTKCLFVPFNPFSRMSWPDVAQLMFFARQKILARSAPLLWSEVQRYERRVF